jgi:hypothetical protein
MKSGPLFGIAAILAVVGYFSLQAYDRYHANASNLQTRQFEALRLQNELLSKQFEDSKPIMQEAGAMATCLVEYAKSPRFGSSMSPAEGQ